MLPPSRSSSLLSKPYWRITDLHRHPLFVYVTNVFHFSTVEVVKLLSKCKHVDGAIVLEQKLG